MNIEHYRNFIAIVESGTLSAAARKICVAQPALTNQIKNLEAAFGAQLMKRGPRQIELTDAGAILYERAKAICLLEDTAQQEIQDCAAGGRGVLSLGVTPAFPDQFLEGILFKFRSANPLIQINMFELNTIEIMEMLKNGVVEIGIVRNRQALPPYLQPCLQLDEELMVVYNQDNPWFSPDLDKVPLSMLAHVPLSIPRGFRNVIVDLCLNAGFKPNILNISTSRTATLMWARRGDAVSIITAPISNALNTEDICSKQLCGAEVSTKRSIVVVKERKLSSVSRRFLEHVLASFPPQIAALDGEY